MNLADGCIGSYLHTHFMTAPSYGALHDSSGPQQGMVRRPGPPHSASAATHCGSECSSTHFIAAPPRSCLQVALPQQGSVRRPGPPHSPLVGTHCGSGCSSTHFMIPSPPKSFLHLALPQHFFGNVQGPPHTPPSGWHHQLASASKVLVELMGPDGMDAATSALPRKLPADTPMGPSSESLLASSADVVGTDAICTNRRATRARARARARCTRARARVRARHARERARACPCHPTAALLCKSSIKASAMPSSPRPPSGNLFASASSFNIWIAASSNFSPSLERGMGFAICPSSASAAVKQPGASRQAVQLGTFSNSSQVGVEP